MNGGSRTRVISAPFTNPNAVVASSPHATAETGIQPVIDRHPAHDDRAERHHHAARQVDARREDDQRLADGDHADDHHLLQDQREVLSGEEPVGLRREERAREQQREEGTGGGHDRRTVAACALTDSSARSCYLPQQAFMPKAVSLLSTPFIGLSVMSVTPVSVVPDTFLPVLA